MTRHARALLVAIALSLLLAGAVIGAQLARADTTTCTTSYMSGQSYTLCRHSAPWSPATMTICNPQTGYCTTR